MTEFPKIIQEICQEEHIKFSLLSKDWVIMLEKNQQTKFITGYKFDLNRNGLGLVMDDKYATFSVLRQKGIPIIEHQIFFKPTNSNAYALSCNSYDLVVQYFQDHQENIVLKANDSTCGLSVYHVTDVKEIKPTLDKLFSKSFSISICPFYNIKAEYRLIVLNNECVLCYGKKRPIVVGDGTSSIYDLLCRFNPYYFKEHLKEEEYFQVLPKGEVLEYNWQFNLSKGAMPFEVKDGPLKQKLSKLLAEITKSMHLGFCSVDIIETTNQDLMVMEINSGVMMKNFMQIVPDGVNIAKEIYHQAIIAMFKEG